MTMLAVQEFASGLGIMRPLALRTIYKQDFRVEPADMQWYMTIMGLPSSFRFLVGLFVDSKVVAKRKYILMIASTISTIC